MKRGAGIVLFVVGAALVASAAGLLLLYAMVGTEPSVPTRATLVLRPSGDLPELASDTVLGLVRQSDAGTIGAYVESLRKAKRDPRIAAVLLAPGGFTTPYWARIQELRDAILDFRTSGKPVVAFLEYAGDREYYLASAADRILLMPSATVDLTGVASYEVFLRGAFDWVGTYPDFVKIGRYKTAVNQLAERTFTEAHREMTESLTHEAFTQLVRGVADGRRLPEDQVRTLIDQGPFLAEDAVDAGLVDDLAYEDQIDDVSTELPEDWTRNRVSQAEYARVSWSSLGVSRQGRIAVIHAVGAIQFGRSSFDPVGGGVLGSDSLIADIRRARGDASVAAIVLRIDSPGGSSTASDAIWRELTITRERGIPVIVSMADVAASGGYYIAMPGDVIVAEPGTLTGSIGIYSGKFAVGGTLEKIGVNVEAVSEGAHAELESPVRPFSPSERAKLQAQIEAFYAGFLEKAARSRNTTPEKIDAVAQGRVWTGRQARDLGLVDALGGLAEAVAIAKQRAGMPDDQEPELVHFPAARSFYEVLSDELETPGYRASQGRALAAFLDLFPAGHRRAIATALTPMRLFRSGEVLAHMPYVFLR
ncbi:MAG: signal peptide peptidase SppA [Vicinamibacterales bacterium]